MSKKKSKKKPSRGRKAARLIVAFALLVGLALSMVGEWFVHHPHAWVSEQEASFKDLASFIESIGYPVANLTDALGWTGYDTVYDYDVPAPTSSIFFAGEPRRTGPQAPADVRVLNRGEFVIGWSDALKHPLWCAYHIAAPKYPYTEKRPSFLKDKEVPASPSPDDYKNSGYDRGHMVPNYAILTRFGEEAQRKTFRMTNISPQTAPLNRGVWRDLEHRIAELWTAKYGDVWVIVGSIPSGQVFSEKKIDVPGSFYQLVLAQNEGDLRALAVLIPQRVGWNAWPARYIVSIDDLEALTGLDFNPELPAFIQDPLEAETPSRLWPIRPLDIFHLLSLHASKAW